MSLNTLEPIIGLEVHVQLSTKSKAFCGCSTEFGAEPNSHTCPVCLGLPGTLPVLNKTAFEHSIKVALALNCQIQNSTRFDRKNYFYPDLPKNFQISQYDLPIGFDGSLKLENRSIMIKRVHLEEDAGKLIHEENASLVDYNRTGIPLLEIVTEPDINSALEAYEYLKNLKALLLYLDVSSCDMEKGILRCDANISLRKKGTKELGVKSELKNLNSFKAVRMALEFEIERQFKALEKGEKIVQETRLWDAKKLQSFTMRSKEEAKDYRYFPEPDLPLFKITQNSINTIKEALPELPNQKKQRFIIDYALSPYDAEVLTISKGLANYFEDCLKIYKDAKKVSNWITGSFQEELNKRDLDPSNIRISPQNLIELIKLTDENVINNLSAKQVLSTMFDTLQPPKKIVEENNLAQISDVDGLTQACDQVIKENSKTVSDYLSGKNNALMFLVGQVMRQTKGKANPKIVAQLLTDKIKGQS